MMPFVLTSFSGFSLSSLGSKKISVALNVFGFGRLIEALPLQFLSLVAVGTFSTAVSFMNPKMFLALQRASHPFFPALEERLDSLELRPEFSPSLRSEHAVEKMRTPFHGAREGELTFQEPLRILSLQGQEKMDSQELPLGEEIAPLRSFGTLSLNLREDQVLTHPFQAWTFRAVAPFKKEIFAFSFGSAGEELDLQDPHPGKSLETKKPSQSGFQADKVKEIEGQRPVAKVSSVEAQTPEIFLKTPAHYKAQITTKDPRLPILVDYLVPKNPSLLSSEEGRQRDSILNTLLQGQYKGHSFQQYFQSYDWAGPGAYGIRLDFIHQCAQNTFEMMYGHGRTFNEALEELRNNPKCEFLQDLLGRLFEKLSLLPTLRLVDRNDIEDYITLKCTPDGLLEEEKIIEMMIKGASKKTDLSKDVLRNIFGKNQSSLQERKENLKNAFTVSHYFDPHMQRLKTQTRGEARDPQEEGLLGH